MVLASQKTCQCSRTEHGKSPKGTLCQSLLATEASRSLTMAILTAIADLTEVSIEETLEKIAAPKSSSGV